VKNCDIDNPTIVEHQSFEKVGPLSYAPDESKVKRNAYAFSLSGRFPHITEIYKAKEPRPGPQDYQINEKFVKMTRHKDVLAGGYSPKDYFKANGNPGPGDYENPTSIADLTRKRSEKLSSNFASRTG